MAADIPDQQRWRPEGDKPATRAQVKEEWRIHIQQKIEEHLNGMPFMAYAGNLARDLADEFVEHIAECVKRATGKELP